MNLFDEWKEALPQLDMQVPFNLEKHAVAVFRVGSHSHGTYVAPEHMFGIDDVDLMVICIPPPEYRLGLRPWEHASYKHGRLDVVFYEWGKWLRMLLKSNPNVIGTLWLEHEDMMTVRSTQHGFIGCKALTHLFLTRERLISREMYPAFIGYARGQLYKMTHHAHQGYMGDKRKRLVEQFGYDVKNAAHMIRLLRMACEAFETGVVRVRRKTDAQELISIKQGEWPLERVDEEAARLFARADQALVNTKLPETPDSLLVQQIMLDGYREAWGWS